MRLPLVVGAGGRYRRGEAVVETTGMAEGGGAMAFQSGPVSASQEGADVYPVAGDVGRCDQPDVVVGRLGARVG